MVVGLNGRVLFLAVLAAAALAAGFAQGKRTPWMPPGTQAALPVVLWHGMGDTCCDPDSMGRVQDLIETSLSVYVYSVRLAETVGADRDAGFFGSVPKQVRQVCETIASDPKLAGGYNAIGFSQGGQFLRAVVEVCPTLVPSMPPCRKLVTFGGQHQGVMDWPGCGNKVSLDIQSLQSWSLPTNKSQQGVRSVLPLLHEPAFLWCLQ